MNRKAAPEYCPVCGEAVPRRALACPECGADHNSGWSEEADLSGLDLPEDDFDYDQFVRDEFGSGRTKSAIHPVWWMTAVVLLLVLLWAILRVYL